MNTVTEFLNIAVPFAILLLTAFGGIVWHIITEMRTEMKEIAEVAYTARAQSNIIEERRKNVEIKLDELVDLNRELLNKIDTMREEINEIKMAQAVAEATKPIRRKTT